jgi:hypothetical protein
VNPIALSRFELCSWLRLLQAPRFTEFPSSLRFRDTDDNPCLRVASIARGNLHDLRYCPACVGKISF